MALDDSALLEMIEMLRTADGGELMRRLLGGMLQAVVDAEATAHIAAGVPYTGGNPIILDISTSAIAEGKIKVAQFADIAEFVAAGARMRNGETLPADLIVLATGYTGPESLVRKLFGDGVADRVGRIWGFDEEEQEVRNVWSRTNQPGLWFMAGSFAQSRIYSKYLALQIKGMEEGFG